MSKVHSECKTTINFEKVKILKAFLKNSSEIFIQSNSSKESLFSIFTHHKAFIELNAKKNTIHSTTTKKWIKILHHHHHPRGRVWMDGLGIVVLDRVGPGWVFNWKVLVQSWSSSRVRSLILLLGSRGYHRHAELNRSRKLCIFCEFET